VTGSRAGRSVLVTSALFTALSAQLCLADTASAARAYVGAAEGVFPNEVVEDPEPEVEFIADPGELNNVQVSFVGGRYRFRDAGAVIEPGFGCRQEVDRHEVSCMNRGFGLGLLGPEVDLRDGNDRVTFVAEETYPGDIDITAAGGPGNDVVFGGNFIHGQGGNDLLLGGVGPDRLRGGAGDDRIEGGPGADEMDGDVGADVMNGGPGRDLVDYLYTYFLRRRVRIDMTLDGLPNDGQPGEHDNVGVDVEQVADADPEGGSLGIVSAGTFIGNERANKLDTKTGEDYIDGAGGRDRLDSGAQNDAVRARDDAADKVNCGRGFDFAIVDRRDNVVRKGGSRCELVDAGRRKQPAAGRDVFVEPGACETDGALGLELPSMDRTVPLADDVLLPLESTLDAEECDVSVDAEGDGGGMSAELHGAEFSVDQSPGERATTLRLTAPHCGRSSDAHAARHNRPPYVFTSRVKRKRKRRRARGAQSSFTPVRVMGRSSVATVNQPASWTTEERCNATVTTVDSGRVVVRDFGRARPIVLTAGESYTARAGR
jgi:hypothetical protein